VNKHLIHKELSYQLPRVSAPQQPKILPSSHASVLSTLTKPKKRLFECVLVPPPPTSDRWLAAKKAYLQQLNASQQVRTSPRKPKKRRVILFEDSEEVVDFQITAVPDSSDYETDSSISRHTERRKIPKQDVEKREISPPLLIPLRKNRTCHHCRSGLSNYPKMPCSSSLCSLVFCERCIRVYHNIKLDSLSSADWLCFRCTGTCVCQKCRSNRRRRGMAEVKKEPSLSAVGTVTRFLSGNGKGKQKAVDQDRLDDVRRLRSPSSKRSTPVKLLLSCPPPSRCPSEKIETSCSEHVLDYDRPPNPGPTLVPTSPYMSNKYSLHPSDDTPTPLLDYIDLDPRSSSYTTSYSHSPASYNHYRLDDLHPQPFHLSSSTFDTSFNDHSMAQTSISEYIQLSDNYDDYPSRPDFDNYGITFTDNHQLKVEDYSDVSGPLESPFTSHIQLTSDHSIHESQPSDLPLGFVSWGRDGTPTEEHSYLSDVHQYDDAALGGGDIVFGMDRSSSYHDLPWHPVDYI
jgi:hypothetical protein